MSKELFDKVIKEVYIIPNYLSVKETLDKEAPLDIKPLVENFNKFSEDIYSLSEDNMKTLLNGLTRIYDLQAASTGRLGILRGSICKYLETSIMNLKMKDNRFFKPVTNDIRDIFSVDDVKEIFKISNVYYNDDINNIIKKNLPKLVNEYLAKEISGVYIFTRAGVQLLLNNAKNNTKPTTVTPVVKVEKPKDTVAIKLDKDPEKVDDNDTNTKGSYYIKSSSLIDLKYFAINSIKPFVGGNKEIFVPIHKENDYKRVLLNMIWYFELYMGLPFFFNELVNGSEVCATQTKELLIFHEDGLRNLLKTYYTYFYRRDVTFTLKEFIDSVKDMGYLPDKHTLCYNGKEVNNVIVFDKNIIARYIIDNQLIDKIPGFYRNANWWKYDVNAETYNAVALDIGFIDLGRKWVLSERKTFTPVDNSKEIIKIDYPTCINTQPTTNVDEALEKDVVKKAAAIIPEPTTEFDKVLYNTDKNIYLSDIVSWVIENSKSIEDENVKIEEVYNSLVKYSGENCDKFYKSKEELASVIRDFSGELNPVLFNKKYFEK